MLISLVIALLSTSCVARCTPHEIRGVNLGGWLVLEPWITPSIFEEVNAGKNDIDLAVDEYTYAEYVDKSYAKERLERHWDTFFNESDIYYLASKGISHIRIPIGYWMVDVEPNEPFPAPSTSDVTGMRYYLLRMMKWAQNNNIKVLLDLHTGPGGQNGFDNSGIRGRLDWAKGDNPDRTIRILKKIAIMAKSWISKHYINESTLWGIEVLNEPAGFDPNIWKVIQGGFYQKAYGAIREILPNPAMSVVIQSAFRGYDEFNDIIDSSEYPGLILDNHNYQSFGDYWNALAAERTGWYTHLLTTCRMGYSIQHSRIPTFLGEFSLAVTSCQKYLDSGWATPYIAPGAPSGVCDYYNSDFSTYRPEYITFLKQYFLAQLDAYEKGSHGIGWFFWTAKTENNCAPEWDFIYLLRMGVIPDLCHRSRFCYSIESCIDPNGNYMKCNVDLPSEDTLMHSKCYSH